MAFSVSMRPSKLAISWFNSSVECDGCSFCTSSAVCGGGFEALIRDGGVLVSVLELLVDAFLYGDEFGRIVTWGCVTIKIDHSTQNNVRWIRCLVNRQFAIFRRQQFRYFFIIKRYKRRLNPNKKVHSKNYNNCYLAIIFLLSYKGIIERFNKIRVEKSK